MKGLLIVIILLVFKISYGQNWSLIKNKISPVIELSDEFGSMYRQPLATSGWEDGIHISDDGLTLYCTYVPVDLLSFVLNGSLPNNFTADYSRGSPNFGMDLIYNPIGATEWLHSDILYAHRDCVNDSFGSWMLSDLARPFFSEGAPAPMCGVKSDSVEFMLFTSNDNATNNTDIWFMRNTGLNPGGPGMPIPFPVNTLCTEDNPHLVRLDSGRLILFFDSDNLPNGKGDLDIWFSESTDNGANWSSPVNVGSVNTGEKEHQPFLYKDPNLNRWFLYYSAIHTDGKLAIFRVVQNTVNDWDSWGSSELVISAGNSAGVGEPTLTSNGDVSFVVVYADPELSSMYNRFDSDPWFLKKK